MKINVKWVITVLSTFNCHISVTEILRRNNLLKLRHMSKLATEKNWTRICAAEMAVRYAALCRKVHVCHCNSLGGATWRSITGRTDRRTDRVWRNMRPPPREEGRIIITILHYRQQYGICCDSYTAERKSSVLQCNPQTSEFECVCTELTHLLILCVRVLINISLNVAR